MSLVIISRVCPMHSAHSQQSPLQSKWTVASIEALKAHHKTQPLCADFEGWGPISALRWDFTPCFLDVLLVIIAAWGFLGGLAAILFLMKKRTPSDVKKNWHYYSKL